MPNPDKKICTGSQESDVTKATQTSSTCRNKHIMREIAKTVQKPASSGFCRNIEVKKLI